MNNYSIITSTGYCFNGFNTLNKATEQAFGYYWQDLANKDLKDCQDYDVFDNNAYCTVASTSLVTAKTLNIKLIA